ncbi:MAG: DUF5723 family protein [Bacteroidota bacterium]|nr:DUF5723 family protein [Bacteroidota bacterium]
MYKIILLVVVFFITVIAYGQERIGLSTGNYSGINSALINPSAVSGSRYYFDVNIVGGGVFVFNNAVFLRNEDYALSSFLSKNMEFKTFVDEYDNDRYVEEYNDTEVRDLNLNTRIIGPSAMLMYGKHTFGIQTGVRSVISGKNIHYEIAKFAYEGLDFEPLHNINFIENKDLDISVLNWAEIGAVYSYNLYSRYYDRVDVGISLKYLLGHSSFYAHFDNMDYVVPNDSTVDIRNMNGEVGFSMPVNYDNNNYPDGSGLFKGKGLGFDIGFTYTQTEKIQKRYNRFLRFCRQPNIRYKFKFGVALLDVGYINFDKNAQVHSYKDVDSYWEGIDDEDFDNVNDMMRRISSKLYNGDSDASNTNVTSYKVALPSALSIQFDYHYFGSWYINGLLLQGISTNYIAPHRNSVVAVTPRFETSLFEVQIPLSLYDYQHPRVGLSARLGVFTVGTENIGYLMGMKDFNGMDFYFSLKMNISKGNCRGGKDQRCQNYEYGLPRK